MAKVNFPHEALIYAGFIKATLDALVASALIIPALVVFRVDVDFHLLLFPFALGASLLIGSALGVLLLPIAALYSDIGRGIQLVLRFGFFFTPVAFPLPISGVARTVMMLNPMTPIVLSGRDWLTGSHEAMPIGFFWATAGAAVLLAISLLFFKLATPHLIERLGE
jgi:lipopolysaccharide transport system permease protein